MNSSVRYECNKHINVYGSSPRTLSATSSANSMGALSIGADDTQSSFNILCTHDGVLLKKASAEHISDLNTSGSLSLVEYTAPPPRRLYIEWRPNDNILIADDTQDQGDWALVDTISRRKRTISECKAFNTKPGCPEPEPEPELLQSQQKSFGGMRTHLDALCALEVKHRGQTVRFIRKSDRTLHSEFFFQHGNADLFVHSMRQLHIIENSSPTNRDEYIILNMETQKLKKTFAELDIGEIKSSTLSNESWLPHKVVGFLVNFPDYVQPHKMAPKARPISLSPPMDSCRQRSSAKSTYSSSSSSSSSSTTTAVDNNYQLVGLEGVASHGSSLYKSPDVSELENVKEIAEKPINVLPIRQQITRGAPLNETQWLEFLMPNGRISDATRIKEIIFRGGIESSLRSEVWKFLLNYYLWSDTAVERIERRKLKSMEYYSMKAQWLSMTTAQEANFCGYRERKSQIEKDVRRTDRTHEFFAGDDNPNLELLQGILMTYVMYNFDLGYVQGMSDLLAPILAVQENEVDAFWCFAGFMDIIFTNFDVDQAGMKTQFSQLRRLLEFANPRLFNYMQTNDSDNMYFCFRWLLVWYKREFSNDDVLKLWECLWTGLPCPNFHILISVAILDQETDIIIESKYEFTEILKHVNELSMNIDLKSTLETAEAIYLQIKNAENVPNDVRRIIGEPLLEEPLSTSEATPQQDFEDGFDTLVRELSPEERQKQQELLEEACERSMFLQHL